MPRPPSGWGGCLRERRSFTLPAARSWPRWWLVASVLAHFVVLTALVESSMSWHRERASRFVVLGALPPGESNRPIVLFVPAAPPPGRRGRGTGEAPGRAAGLPAAAIESPTAPPIDSGTPILRLGAGGRDTATTALAGSRSSRGVRGVTNYTPQLGDGRVWVNPVTGGRVTASREIHLDSMVAVRMQQLADSMEKNPLPDVNADPYVSRPWTFRVGGKTYGIDSKGLHLGDITIPTAVLAFLSTPQGNIDQARANQAYMAMRADILRAAARAQAMDDFREAVREIRERKEKEHEEQQQQQQQPQPQQGNPQPVQP